MATKNSRPQRTPLANRSVLGVKGRDPDYMYRIVNDVGDRINSFQEAGWEIVADKDVTIGDRRCGRASQDGSGVTVPVGNGVQGYLLRQKKAYYQEDQDFKEKTIRDLERSMKQDAEDNNFYGKIKMSSSE